MNDSWKEKKKYLAGIQVSLDHTGGEISLLKIQMPFKLLFLHHNVFICHSEGWKTWFRNRALTLPCCCSVANVRLFVTPWTAARQASLFCTISWSLLKVMSIELMMPSNYLILCHSLLSNLGPWNISPSVLRCLWFL